jgi:DNA-binding beta-propeller fold protein YncE
LAFGAAGNLYVSLALTNQISVLNPAGAELRRFSSQPGDAAPLDSPAGIAFDSCSKSLLVANHALLTGDPSHFALLQLYTGDPGDPLVTPDLP